MEITVFHAYMSFLQSNNASWGICCNKHILSCELLLRDSVRTSLLSCDKAHVPQLPLFASVIRGGRTLVAQLIHSTWPECHNCNTRVILSLQKCKIFTINNRKVYLWRAWLTRAVHPSKTRELCMIGHYPGSLVPRPHPSDAAAAAGGGGGGEGQRSESAPVVSQSHQNYHLVLK